MKAETRSFIKEATALATEAWYRGSNGEPGRVYSFIADRRFPVFQICRRKDITPWKEQIFAAIKAKQAEWLASVKGLSKSALYEAVANFTHGIEIKTGIEQIDEIGLYAKFWETYYRNRKHYATAYEPGRFRFSVQWVWETGSYDSARRECRSWIIFLKDDKLYLENWTFPDFRNPDHKLSKGRCRTEYLKVAKADLMKTLEDGWQPLVIKGMSVYFQKPAAGGVQAEA